MCVIIHLPEGKFLGYAKLKNAVLNNPHGFGVVCIDDGKLEVFRSFTEKGTDPEFVAKQIEELKDRNKFVHLRYATHGDKNEENVHPFTVYNSQDNHQIEFMHNGSLYRFKDDSQKTLSDTRLFASNFLSPLLYKFTGDNGVADIEDNLLEKILSEYFSNTNRGLLLSNKLEPLYLGGWHEVTDGSDKFKVSNNDYFDRAQEGRMTDFYKPQSSSDRFRGTTGNPPNLTVIDGKKEQESSTNPTSETSTSGDVRRVQLKDINLTQTGRFLNPADIQSFISNFSGEIDDETLQWFGWHSLLEIRLWVNKNPDSAARVLEHISLRLQTLLEEYEELAEKKERGEKLIATLRETIKNMDKENERLQTKNDNQAETIRTMREEIEKLSKKNGRKTPVKKDAA